MKCKTIIKHLEDWAPKESAWQKDNPGIQAGSELREVENVFLCLELTEDALGEAIRKKCNFIFTHHPLIFQPLKSLNTLKDKTSRIIEQLIKNDITLYSAHTNLDFTQQGVSFQLAHTLDLTDIKFLKNLEGNKLKLVIFVPKDHLEPVSEAVFTAGAGVIGNYTNCGFTLEGTGSFRGNENSNPKVGSPLKTEHVGEARLEVLLDSWKLGGVLKALNAAHPYEEPAYDIHPLLNENPNFGYGAVGTLKNPMSRDEFLRHVSEKLSAGTLRYSGGRTAANDSPIDNSTADNSTADNSTDISKEGSEAAIRKVAVCGGSGSDLLQAAIASGADAFVTADVKYHTFFDAQERILLVDAGHYETERVILKETASRISALLKSHNQTASVYIYTGSTNPVKYFNNL